jgi:excisionase family DNA binding protein
MRPNTTSLNETTTQSALPILMTATEVADLLRTSPKAIYTMVERGQLDGVVRIGRRMLVRRDELVDWLRKKSASSPKE